MERLVLEQARIVGGGVEVFQDDEWKPAGDINLNAAGIGDSTGFVFIGEGRALYFSDTQPDTATLIDLVTQLTDGVNQLSGAVNTISLQMISRSPDTVPLDPGATAISEQVTALTEQIGGDLDAIELI